jgi:hypothetical protein
LIRRASFTKESHHIVSTFAAATLNILFVEMLKISKTFFKGK